MEKETNNQTQETIIVVSLSYGLPRVSRLLNETAKSYKVEDFKEVHPRFRAYNNRIAKSAVIYIGKSTKEVAALLDEWHKLSEEEDKEMRVLKDKYEALKETQKEQLKKIAERTIVQG